MQGHILSLDPNLMNILTPTFVVGVSLLSEVLTQSHSQGRHV